MHSAMAAGDWLKVGQEAGLMIDQVIIGSSDPKNVGIDIPKDVKIAGEVVGGILMGAVKAEGLDNIMNCIHDSEVVVSDVSSAIGDFKKHDAKETLAGLKKLASGVFEIRAALTDCRGVAADFAKLGKMAAIFSNPATFAFHVGKDIIVNGVQIYHEVEDSVVQFHGEHYEAFGEDIGEALAKLLLGGAWEVQEEYMNKKPEEFGLF